MIDSPATNDPEITETSRIFVIALQDLTLAVVLLMEPVTTSLKIYVPVLPTLGDPIVIVGAEVYPTPASLILIAVTIPAE